jgi:methylmalonyl-CoA mutase N-terminal domain/subunit
MRLTTDLFAYCHERIPKWNTVSISGYHFREKGASAVQEVAFTLASGMAYVQAAIDAGLQVDDFAPRLAFFFNGHNNVFQEVAKFRAARNMWAHAMRERFGARDPRSMMLRFHTQTGGVTLTAQQPLNNVVRVAVQALAAVLGGTQSLHTNGYDEALALPTAESARLALRTQQVLASESGVADTIDPLGGSYYVEQLTDALEREAMGYLDRIAELGGAARALHFFQDEISKAAYAHQLAVERGGREVVGVNVHTTEEGALPIARPAYAELEAHQRARLEQLRARRDGAAVAAALAAVRDAAAGQGNLLPPIVEAVRAEATLGEISDVLRAAWGVYHGVAAPVPNV